MKKSWLIGFIIIFSGCHIAGTAPQSTLEKARSVVLFDFEGDFDLDAVETTDAQVSLTKTEKGNTLRITTGHKEQKPIVVLKAAEGHWDLCQFLYVAMDVRNEGTDDVLVTCRVDNNKWVDGGVTVPSGETGTLMVLLKRNSPPEHFKKYLFGMNGTPGGYVWIWEEIDLEKVAQLFVSVVNPRADCVIEIDNVRVEGVYAPPSEEVLKTSFFPFIDEYGQYIHKDWSGKMHCTEDFGRYHKEEMADLAGHPGPSDWNRYGGWEAGPKLEATGHFRVEKNKSKWWLVDPEGRLFWSHGIDCVRANSSTPITDREHYFKNLPDTISPLAKFYGTDKWAPHGYYKDRASYKTYDFGSANLLLKFGEDWQQGFADISHRRLRSWGMNTIANWSDAEIYLERKTPYVGTIHSGGSAIQGSKGTWRKFPDPFDPAFRDALRERLAKEKGKSAGDPWCIGYFIDNELTWGDEVFLGLSCIASPVDQPAKKIFIDDLKAKYETIEKLNAIWGTEYTSWDGLLQSREEPDREKAEADLKEFCVKIAEEYFRICREEVKRIAPESLYLGCRFDFHFYPEELTGIEWPLATAAKYCDVISFNRYRYSARALRPPNGIDKPVIIGEFHFGALDRGMFHTGLRSVADQAQRGQAYISYVHEALENPYIVGTHWFQYKDQPTTGRGDGENYQVGFIDICDGPYPETVAASREVGYKMYEYRL
jgi:hypothetical protein